MSHVESSHGWLILTSGSDAFVLVPKNQLPLSGYKSLILREVSYQQIRITGIWPKMPCLTHHVMPLTVISRFQLPWRPPRWREGQRGHKAFIHTKLYIYGRIFTFGFRGKHDKGEEKAWRNAREFPGWKNEAAFSPWRRQSRVTNITAATSSWIFNTRHENTTRLWKHNTIFKSGCRNSGTRI